MLNASPNRSENTTPGVKKRTGFTLETLQLLESARVFHDSNHRKQRLDSGIEQLDYLLDGGIARGRISEFVGQAGSGRTSIAASFAASATQHGEVVGWIDYLDAFDPASIMLAGIDPARLLWISTGKSAHRFGNVTASGPARRLPTLLKAAELVLDAGGFGLVVIDFGNIAYPISQAASLRLARAVERSASAAITITTQRICGACAALSLTIRRLDAVLDRRAAGAPALFDGLQIEVGVARNRLGRAGGTTVVHAVTDQSWRHAGVTVVPPMRVEGARTGTKLARGC